MKNIFKSFVLIILFLLLAVSAPSLFMNYEFHKRLNEQFKYSDSLRNDNHLLRMDNIDLKHKIKLPKDTLRVVLFKGEVYYRLK